MYYLIIVGLLLSTVNYGQTYTNSAPEMFSNESNLPNDLTFNFAGVLECITSDIVMEVCVRGDLDGDCSAGDCPVVGDPCPDCAAGKDEFANVFVNGFDTGVELGNTDETSFTSGGGGICDPICQTITIPCVNAAPLVASGMLEIVFRTTADVNSAVTNCPGAPGTIRFAAEIISLEYSAGNNISFSGATNFCATGAMPSLITVNGTCGIIGGFTPSMFPGFIDNGDNTATFDPTGIPTGTYTTTFSYICGDGTTAYSSELVINVLDQPMNLSIAPNTICNAADNSLTLEGDNIPGDGTLLSWYGLGSAMAYVVDSGTAEDPTGTFLAGAPVGTYTVCVDVIDGLGGTCFAPLTYCQNIEVTFFELPEPVEIDIECNVDPTGTVSVVDLFFGLSNAALADATYIVSGGSVVGGAFIYDDFACFSIQAIGNTGAPCFIDFDITSHVFVTEEPSPTFTMQDQACWSTGDAANLVTPTVTSPAYTGTVARSWAMTGTDITGGTFNTADGSYTVSGTGTMIVTLTETVTTALGDCTGPNICSESYSQSITVEDGTSLDPSFTATPNPVCINQVVSLSPSTSGGVFSGNGVTDNGLGTGGTFTASTAGTYPITYSLNSPNGCTNSSTINIEVFPAVDASLDDLHIACEISPNGNLNLTGLFTSSTTSGGTFSLLSSTGTGTVAGDNLNYSAPGCYEIQYVADLYTGASGACSDTQTAFVLVSEEPQPSFDIQDQVCWSSADPASTHLYTPTVSSPTYDGTVVRTWSVVSGPATINNASTGEIQVTGAGTVVLRLTETINYLVCGTTAAGSCSETFDVSINIEDGTSQNAAFTTDITYPCIGEVVTLTPSTQGGFFSGIGVVNNMPGIEGQFTPPSCGTWSVSYVINTTNGCSALYTINITTDLTDPTIDTAPTDLIVDCDGAGNTTDLSTWLGANGNAIATDNCVGTLTWVYELVSFEDSCSTAGTQTYRFTVTDVCGNIASADADFTIRDVTAPAISTPAQNLAAECNGSSNATEILDWLNANGNAVATDNCSGLTWTNDYGSFVADCGTTGAVLVTFTVSDECGNSSSTAATFTINDAVAPYWEIAPADLNIECDGSTDPMSQIQSWLDISGGGSANDSCSLVVYSNDYTAFTGGCSAFTGAALVTFTATDACGNATTAQATVTITDNNAPIITSPAQDTIVECDGSENPADLATWLGIIANATAYDTCSAITWNTPVLLETIDNCGGTLVHVYSFTADDECGNTSAATIANFTIIDTTDPVFDTAPIEEVVECDGLGNVSELNTWLAANGNGTASDICSAVVLWEYDFVSEVDSCGLTARYTYRFTITDECANTSTSEADFVIRDITAPMITAPAQNFAAECNGASNAAEILNWLNNNGFATATDACSDLTWSNDYGSIIADCGTTGEVTVTFTVSDDCGNTSTTAATFTINDAVAPYWEIDPADLNIECDGSSDPMSQIQSWLDISGGGVAVDSCSLITYSDDYTAFTGGCSAFTGAALVTFTATDACGNATTAQATVTITDNNAPIITSPAQDTIVECDGSGNPADLATWLGIIANATAYDTCSAITWNTPVLLETIDNCGGTLVHVYSFTADDECGNTSAATIANFTIIDTTDPVFDTAPIEEVVECDGLGNVSELNTWLAANGNGTASDICSAVVLWEYDFVSEVDSCGLTARYTYRFTITDECANTSTSEADFVIRDITAPMITAPAQNFAAECNGASNAAEILNWLNNNGFATATDACSDLTWSNDYGSIIADCGTTGEVTVTFTVSDDCGNTSTTAATFTINDAVAPIWEIEPADLNIECDGSSDPMSQIQSWLDISGGGVAVDSCSLITYSDDYTAFTGGCSAFTGAALVTFTATDACGNATTAQATVTITDNNAPIITSPAQDTIVECDGLGNPVDLATWLGIIANATAYDTCSAITWNTPILLETIDNCGGTLVYVYSFTADDECGNTSAATIANFNIIDTNAPVFDIAPMEEVVECDGLGNVTELDAWLLANGNGAATDICNAAVTWNYDLVSVVDSCGLNGRSTYRFTVSDDCGNTDTAEADFVIRDLTAPAITTPAQAFAAECNGSSNAAEILNWLNNNGFAAASDDCSDVTWTNDYGSITADCGTTGSVLVTFTAADECGNTTSTSATFTINDGVAPVWEITPADITIQCNDTDDPFNQIQSWLDIAGGGEAKDSCSLVVYSDDFVALSGGCSINTGTALVTFTASDACGNMMTSSANVTVVDVIAPFISIPAQDTIVECDGLGNPGGLAEWLALNGGAQAADLCSEPLMWSNVLVETIANCGSTTISTYAFSATDACGNTSVQTLADFIITDSTDPIFDTAPINETATCDGSGNATELNAWLIANGNGAASDICGMVAWTYDLVAEIDSCGLSARYIYRFTITDDCGNSATAEAEFFIEDVDGPVISAGMDNTVECGEGLVDDGEEFLSWLNNNAGATATESCGALVIWTHDYDAANWTEDCSFSKYVDVTFTANDECGNSSTTTHRFGTVDSTPPVFANCPRERIVIDAVPELCEAYVNFSPIEATDGCGDVTITQTDNTGLVSGSLYPIGLTILSFEAEDDCGNVTSCNLEIEVIDVQLEVLITCPEDVTVTSNQGVCGAIVDSIALIQSQVSCSDNTFATTFTIQDENNNIIGCGIEDASNTVFSPGLNTVNYTVSGQSIVLITELIQDGTIAGVEITNFGPSSVDISSFEFDREGASVENYTVSAATILGVGDVYTQTFTNIPVGTPAGYYVSQSGAVVDGIAINGYAPTNFAWSGTLSGAQALRTIICNSNSSLDYVSSIGCGAGSFGTFNASLPLFPDNGITTTIDANAEPVAECSFTIMVEEDGAPYCASSDTISTISLDVPQSISSASCAVSEINIPNSFIVSDVNILALTGPYADMGSITMSLTSPSGTEVILVNGACSRTADFSINFDNEGDPYGTIPCDPLGNTGTYRSFEDLSIFNSEDALGIWTLSIVSTSATVGELTNWELELVELIPYTQDNVTIENDLGMCAATFDWMNPIFGDACNEGTIMLEYFDANGISLGAPVAVVSGSQNSYLFPGGVTTVLYYLEDSQGNLSTCSFEVTVNDSEAPVLDAGASCVDMTLQLVNGECDVIADYPDFVATDNCDTVNASYSIPEGSVIGVGITTVTLTVTDGSGNSSSCTFDVTVLEYTPLVNTLACNDFINVSLDRNCQAYITTDMVLRGSEIGCDFNYELTLTDPSGNVIGTSSNGTNYVGLDQVGQEITVTICQLNAPFNCCWSTVNVELKQIPEVACPADITINCNEAFDPSITGVPVINTCEQEVFINHYDDYDDNGICGNPRSRIERIWTIIDESNNLVECTQEIVVLPFSLDSIDFPADFVRETALACADVMKDSMLIDTSHTGRPTINGKSIFGAHLCELNVGYWDEYLDDANCSGAYQILRNWIITDECLPIEVGVNPRRHIQAIKVDDLTNPVFNNCVEDVTISTNIWNCTGTYLVPNLFDELADDCGEVVDVQIYVTRGTVIETAVNSNQFSIVNLPIGTHHVKIKGIDNCGNFAVCEFDLTVIDDVPPIVICDLHTVVSLPGDGGVHLYPESIDDGSFDNCSDIKLQIYRMINNCNSLTDTIPGDFVDFCCADVGNEDNRVVLRAWDDADNDGIFATEGDNYSECMVFVEVQDKLPPTVLCPNDTTVDCRDFELYGDLVNEGDLSEVDAKRVNLLFGDPLAASNCGSEISQSLVGDEYCGTGTITRTFKVANIYNDESLTCSQEIEIITLTENTLTCDKISFPKGSREAIANYNWCDPTDLVTPFVNTLTVTNCEGGAFTTPIINIDELCTEAGINLTLDTFDFAGGACKKILAHWEVIDQCVFVENYLYDNNGTFEINPFVAANGYYELYVEYDIFDNIAPEITCNSDLTIGCNETFAGPITGIAEDNCTEAAYLGWAWKLDIDGDGIFNAEGEGSSFTASDAGLDGGVFPLGSHNITWIVSDGCGNISSERCVLSIGQVDNKAPTPYCLNGISTVLMEDSNSIAIWATDFNLGSFDDCTATEDLILSFEEDSIIPSFTVDCSDIENGISQIITLQLWVWDEAGNKDFCSVDLNIQDNQNLCPDVAGATFSLAGNIKTEEGTPIKQTEMRLNSTLAEYPRIERTDDEGAYQFAANPNYFDYELVSERNTSYMEGVSTFDLLLIQRHILGIERFTSPYKVIASDVNNDQKISASDLLSLRKLILGIIETSANKSWRFVDKKYEFNNILRPFPFDEKLVMENSYLDGIDKDFVGVKIGDVNGSYAASIANSVKTRSKNYDVVISQELNGDGNTVINFSSSRATYLEGFQFTLDKGNHQIIKIQDGTVDLNSSNWYDHKNGMMTFSWNSDQLQETDDKDVLFSIVIQGTAKNFGQMSINSKITRAEIYLGPKGTYGLNSKVIGDLKYSQNTEIQLLQNEPNPFNNATSVKFVLPQTDFIKFKIFDQNGKVVYFQEGDFIKGIHEFNFKSIDFKNSGMFFYSIESSNRVLTKKMMLIE